MLNNSPITARLIVGGLAFCPAPLTLCHMGMNFYKNGIHVLRGGPPALNIVMNIFCFVPMAL